MRKRFIAILVLLCLPIIVEQAQGGLMTEDSILLNRIPPAIGEWVMDRSFTIDQAVLDQLRPSDYLWRSYSDPQGRRLDLYIGFHGSGEDVGAVHSPKHCLPGSGWNLVRQDVDRLGTPAGELGAVRAVYAHERTSMLFYYWYMVGAETYTNEYVVKLAELKELLLHRRKNTFLVRVSASTDGGPEAEESIRSFMRELYPALHSLVQS